MKNNLILLLFFAVTFKTVPGQIPDAQAGRSNTNIIKNVAFITQGNIYPLTVLLNPYGYWTFGEIEYGYDQWGTMQYLTNFSCSWVVNGLQVETPQSYIYDTLAIDTITTRFKSLFCRNYPPKHFHANLANAPANSLNSTSFELLKQDFIYSFLLSHISSGEDDGEFIRVIFPTTSSPYKSSFEVVTLSLFSDSVEVSSITLNTTNLLDIKETNNGAAIFKSRDYKRFMKSFNSAIFIKNVDCSSCLQELLNQSDFIVEYHGKEFNSSFYLCDFLYLNVRDKNEKKAIKRLIDLKSSIAYLNEKYLH